MCLCAAFFVRKEQRKAPHDDGPIHQQSVMIPSRRMKMMGFRVNAKSLSSIFLISFIMSVSQTTEIAKILQER